MSTASLYVHHCNYYIVPNYSSLFCLLCIFSTEKIDRWIRTIEKELKYNIPTKAGSIYCCIGMMVLVVVDNTEAGEPSKAG